MKKLITFLIGIIAGAGAGMVGVALFVPETSQELRQRFKAGFQETMTAAREASAKRRAELESELASLYRDDHRGDRL